MCIYARHTYLTRHQQVIPQPRCLNGVLRSLQAGSYKEPLQAYEDLSLVFLNALYYNEPTSQIYKDAVTLKARREFPVLVLTFSSCFSSRLLSRMSGNFALSCLSPCVLLLLRLLHRKCMGSLQTSHLNPELRSLLSLPLLWQCQSNRRHIKLQHRMVHHQHLLSTRRRHREPLHQISPVPPRACLHRIWTWMSGERQNPKA